LDVLKNYFGQPRWIGDEEKKKLIPPILNCYKLELQQPLSKLLMISNCMVVVEPLFEMNPLTRIWRILNANTALAAQFPKYVKLAEIAMVHVLGQWKMNVASHHSIL
jgi:hypothetical protein